MANFASTQTGNWNDGGTYGNTSPGAKGTDWPGLAGDTVTISAGHTVTYNVSETNELGQIDLVGKLASDNNVADRKLTLAHQDLNISGTGEFEIGTSASNFNKAYKFELLFNTTSDNAKGLIIANGGKLTSYGDSTYCSDYEDTLANDAENTDNDTSIKTVTDMSAIWHVGDEITIKVEDAGDSTSHKDAVKKAIIQSFGAGNVIVLDININAAAGVGDTWISPVVNVTRNIQFGKFGADTACGGGSEHFNTNRPKFTDANASGNDNCIFSYGMVTGFFSISSNYDFQFLQSTLRNGYYGFYGGTNHSITGNIYSIFLGFYNGVGHSISCNIYSNYRAFNFGANYTVAGSCYSNAYNFYICAGYTITSKCYSNHYVVHQGSGHIVSGDIYNNVYGFNLTQGGVLSGNIYDNTFGFYGCTGYTISSRVGYNANDVSKPNTYDFYTDGLNKHTLLNAKLPLAGLYVRRNQQGYNVRVSCEHHNQVAHSYKIYVNVGDIIKTACDGTGDAPSQDPDAGSEDCLELSNIQSICDSNNPLVAMEMENFRIWATTGVAKTYTFKVQTTFAGISAGNLKLTANYLDEATGGHQGEQTNAPAINQRATAADWTQTLAVSVTPSQTGWVSFEIKLMEYEANNEVYVWPVPVVT